MDRDQWLQDRRTGVGASEAAAVLGLSPWATAYHVWLDKLGQLPERPLSAAMAWGLRLERAIAEAYEEQEGRTLYSPTGLMRHDRHPWLLATPDRITTDGDRVVELKTAGSAEGWGEPGTDEVPEQYLVQVHHQMAVAYLDLADVAVLIAGQDFRVYHVKRSEAVVAYLEVALARFWHQHVLAKVPPPPDFAHPQTLALLESLQGGNGPEVALAEDTLKLVACYEEATRRMRAYDKDRHSLKAQLLHALGQASVGRLPDGRRIRCKKIQRRGFTVEPTEYLDFRILQPRKRANHDDGDN